MAEGMTTTNGREMNSASIGNAPRQPITPRLSALPGKVLRRLQRYYRRWFQNRNYVFIHKGPFGPELRDDCTFSRHDRFETVPATVVTDIMLQDGRHEIERDMVEMECGAVLWIAHVNEHVASLILCHRGRNFKKWHVPVGGNDIIFSRGRTFTPFRGRGLCSSLMKYAMHVELSKQGVAFSDCRVYNAPSIRLHAKAGFYRLTKVKPLTRAEALGVEGSCGR